MFRPFRDRPRIAQSEAADADPLAQRFGCGSQHADNRGGLRATMLQTLENLRRILAKHFSAGPLRVRSARAGGV